jgi:hypothetical protein
MNYIYEKASKYAFIVGVKTLEAVSYVNNILSYIYENNIIAKQFTDIVSYYMQMAWCDLYKVKCSMPNAVNWYGTSCLIKTNTDNILHNVIRKIPIQQCYYNSFFKSLLFMQDGKYLLSNNEYTIQDVHYDSDISKCVDNVGKILDNELSLVGNIEDCVFIMEYFNLFIVRYAMYTDMDSPKFDELNRTNMSFLSIEYTHPEMESSVFFELDDRFSIIGNELFSPSFVKYLLEHQFYPYVFDNNYALNIMDSNMDIKQLTGKQYIRLNENTYDVVDIVTE